jgi:hypothetical protein
VDEAALNLFARWAPRLAKPMDDDGHVPLPASLSGNTTPWRISFYSNYPV